MNFKKEIFKILCLFSCAILLIANEHIKVKKCESFKSEQIKIIKTYLKASEDYNNCISNSKNCLKEKALYRKTMDQMDKSLNLK